jgi:outer membrane lipoprotein carrier protein
VADGQHLWIYDSELEQVTVRRLDSALSATPLSLLTGDAPVDQAFSINRMATGGSAQWYELRPKQPQSEFSLLRVALDGDILKAIELEDAFNQRTRLSFERVERNVPVATGRFHFEPPPGVDVVGDVP